MSFRSQPSAEERWLLASLHPGSDTDTDTGTDTGTGTHGIALPAGVDGARLLALADRHRVGGLLERLLPAPEADPLAGPVPDPSLHALQAGLRDRRERNVHAFLDQMCSLVTVRDALRCCNVEHAVLKGPTLCRLYADEHERHAGDLDILLREPHAAPLAIQALMHDGWIPLNDWPRWSERWRRRYLLDSKDLSLRRDGGFATLELHWRTFTAGRQTGDEPFERLVTHRAGGQGFAGFGAEDEMVYLVEHGTRHGWMRLKWLADVVRGMHRLDAQQRQRVDERLRPAIGTAALALLRELLAETERAGSAPQRKILPRQRPAPRSVARRLVGVILDLEPSPPVLQRPFRPAIRFRLARLCAALWLQPGDRPRALAMAAASLRRMASLLRRRLLPIVRHVDHRRAGGNAANPRRGGAPGRGQ